METVAPTTRQAVSMTGPYTVLGAQPGASDVELGSVRTGRRCSHPKLAGADQAGAVSTPLAPAPKRGHAVVEMISSGQPAEYAGN